MMSTPSSTSATAVVLTYNRLGYLRIAVRSALVQDHQDMEVLVVDNGSTDGTSDWLSGMDDPRLTVLRLPSNQHPTRARNLGLDRARGRWVGFLDDDDAWAPGKVSKMLTAATAQGAAWAYCGCVYVDQHDTILGGRAAPSPEAAVRDLPVAFTIPGGLSGLMWDTQATSLRLDEALTYCDDWDAALVLSGLGLPAVANQPLMAFRQHIGSWSGTVSDQSAEFNRIAERHADLRGVQAVRLSEHHRYVGGQALRSGNRGQAIAHYLRAIRYGELRSVPRLLVALVPGPLHRWLRLHVLSDRRWVTGGRHWYSALVQEVARSSSTT